MVGMLSFGSEVGPVAASFEDGNKPSGSIKWGEFCK